MKIKNLAVFFTLFLAVNFPLSAEERTVDYLQWRDYMTALAPLGDMAVSQVANGDNPQLQQELYARMMSVISVAYMGLFLGDPQHPDFWPIFNYGHNLGTPNPDNTYYLAPIDENGIYRIAGERGTVRIADIQIGGGLFYPRGEGPLGKTFANYDIDDLDIADDGKFEVIVSPERPQDYAGNWLKMPSGATNILLRQIAYDWINERDGRYAIERLDTPAIRPRPDAREIEQQLKQIAVWVENWTTVTNAMANRIKSQDLVNKVRLIDFEDSGGFDKEKQIYIEGQFVLDDDEALILSYEVPANCRYWNIQLTGMVTWSAIDPINRQSTLNGHSATLDKNRRFYAVISSRDPGVPNWLDTAGYDEGTIFGRFMACPGVEQPSAIKVKFAEIRQHLPKGTPVVSAKERDQQLRLRRQAAQMRHYW